MKKVLYLEKRGCDFWKDETLKSDVGNYRVVTLEKICGWYGVEYFVEFSLWRNRTKSRKTHKKTGKPLKHVHYDVINDEGLNISVSYENEAGSWKALTIETRIDNLNLSYTIEDILKAVNMISIDHYDEIVFID